MNERHRCFDIALPPERAARLLDPQTSNMARQNDSAADVPINWHTSIGLRGFLVHLFVRGFGKYVFSTSAGGSVGDSVTAF
jgi:hypothetical protein